MSNWGLSDDASHEDAASNDVSHRLASFKLESAPPKGDWLTTIDAPRVPRALQNQPASRFSWNQGHYGLPSATSPAPAGGPLMAGLTTPSFVAKETSSNTTEWFDDKSLKDFQELFRRHTLYGGNSPGICDDKALKNFIELIERHKLNGANVPTSTAHQNRLHDGTTPNYARHHPFPMGSPSRQRSMNDLTAPTPMPAITRPKSIPNNTTRSFPPGLPLLNLDDIVRLQLQRIPFNPALYNNNNNLYKAHPTQPSLSPALPHVLPNDSKFVPMLAVVRPDKTGKDFTPAPLSSHQIASLKFSPRYHGMHTENNASMEYLKPEQNCALWLTNLPPDVKEKELLAAIRGIGRIYATYINYPDGITHNTSAAKVVFFTPEAAQTLLAQCTLTCPIIIRGYHVKMALNRIKYAKNSTESGESRVLIITGHKDFVNETSLTMYFQARFQFQIDEVRTLIQHKERAVVEFKFGSYRCQAQMGMKALLLDRPVGLEMVEYGADPCEVGSDDTSFSVAGERIQGKGLLFKVHTSQPA